MSDHGDHTVSLGSTRLGTGFSRQLREHLLARMLDESRRMFAEYFAVDRAHTVMLAEQGIVTADQARQVLLELNRIEALGPDGFSMDPAFDSFLPQIERAMTARIGEAVAGRMHTGRSRIDHDAAVLRLFSRNQLLKVFDHLLACQQSILRLASQHETTLMRKTIGSIHPDETRRMLVDCQRRLEAHDAWRASTRARIVAAKEALHGAVSRYTGA